MSTDHGCAGVRCPMRRQISGGLGLEDMTWVLRHSWAVVAEMDGSDCAETGGDAGHLVCCSLEERRRGMSV